MDIIKRRAIAAEILVVAKEVASKYSKSAVTVHVNNDLVVRLSTSHSDKAEVQAMLSAKKEMVEYLLSEHPECEWIHDSSNGYRVWYGTWRNKICGVRSKNAMDLED